jgi:hypothetical protein
MDHEDAVPVDEVPMEDGKRRTQAEFGREHGMRSEGSQRLEQAARKVHLVALDVSFRMASLQWQTEPAQHADRDASLAKAVRYDVGREQQRQASHP